MLEATVVDYAERVGRAVRWLEDHVHEDVRPADLARVAAFSPYHFHRVFRGVTGESVMACRRRLRLEWGARRLRETDADVTEIALRSGYGSHEAFTRAFTAHFGVSPSGWRAVPSERLSGLRIPEAPDDVEVRTIPARPFLYLRGTGPFADVPRSWARFVELASDSGWYTGSQQLVGRYPDDPEVTPDRHLRHEVGLIPDRPGDRPPPGCVLGTLEGGRWAVAVHVGPYATLSETYLRLVGHWFPSRGLPLADRPCIEVYLNDPAEVPPEELRTEVLAPVG